MIGYIPPRRVAGELAEPQEEIRTGVRNNLGGHVNHAMFSTIMKAGGAKPSEQRRRLGVPLRGLASVSRNERLGRTSALGRAAHAGRCSKSSVFWVHWPCGQRSRNVRILTHSGSRTCVVVDQHTIRQMTVSRSVGSKAERLTIIRTHSLG
jgi:hypothetical protein